MTCIKVATANKFDKCQHVHKFQKQTLVNIDICKEERNNTSTTKDVNPPIPACKPTGFEFEFESSSLSLSL